MAEVAVRIGAFAVVGGIVCFFTGIPFGFVIGGAIIWIAAQAIL
jgi:hypothetical protein